MNKKTYKPIASLSLVEVVNAFGVSLLIPVLPIISSQFGGGYIMYGVLLSIYSLFQFFTAPLRGSLSDKYGRKKILLWSQRGTLMSWVIFGCAWFVPSTESFLGISLPLWIILGARIFDGITAGNNAVINAYTSDISTTRQERVKNFGILAAMGGIGVMVGPLLGGLSSDFSSRGNFGTIICAAFLSIVTFFVIWKYLPQSPYQPPKNTSLLSRKDFISKVNIPRDIIKSSQEDKRLGPLWILIGLFFVLFLGYTTIYVLHASEVLGFSPVEVGLIGTGIGLVFAVNQLRVVPKVSKNTGLYTMLLFGHMIMALGLGLMTFAHETFAFLVYASLVVTGVARCMTLFNTILTQITDQQNEGYILGLKESITAAACIIAPLGGAALYKIFSQEIFIIYAMIASLMVLVVYSQLHLDKKST